MAGMDAHRLQIFLLGLKIINLLCFEEHLVENRPIRKRKPTSRFCMEETGRADARYSALINTAVERKPTLLH